VIVVGILLTVFILIVFTINTTGTFHSKTAMSKQKLQEKADRRFKEVMGWTEEEFNEWRKRK
jgi:hypothetical protein